MLNISWRLGHVKYLVSVRYLVQLIGIVLKNNIQQAKFEITYMTNLNNY